jgi:hypothetical protein
LSLLINNKRNTNFPDDKNDDSNRKQKAEDLINKLMKACNFEDLDDSDNEKWINYIYIICLTINNNSLG